MLLFINDVEMVARNVGVWWLLTALGCAAAGGEDPVDAASDDVSFAGSDAGRTDTWTPDVVALDATGIDAGARDAGASDTTPGDAASTPPIDLRAYWPRSGTPQTYRRSDGTIFGWYRFTEHSMDSFTSLYSVRFDQGTPGVLLSWQKEYPAGDGRCTATYGQLWLGEDQSVIEVGDWFNSASCDEEAAFVAFGYRSLDGMVNDGLTWSPPGGVTHMASPVVEVRVLRQNTPSDPYVYAGHDAYSSVELISHFDEWRAPYGWSGKGIWAPGAGRLYRDVVQIVLFHGTRSPDIAGADPPRRCDESLRDPLYERAELYRPFSNYETYAIELYLARGVGIVKEALLFTESSFWGASNVCAGAIMGGAPHEPTEATWSWVLDSRAP